MDIFLNAAQQIPEYKKLDKYLDDHNTLPALVTGVSHIHKAHIIGALLQKPKLLPVLVIAESEAESQRLSNDINMMYGAGTALLYPEKELLLGDFEAASREYEHKRIFALSAMLDGTCKAVICSPEAAAQLTIPPEELKQRTITLSADMEISQEDAFWRRAIPGVTSSRAQGSFRCAAVLWISSRRAVPHPAALNCGEIPSTAFRSSTLTLSAVLTRLTRSAFLRRGRCFLIPQTSYAAV